MESALAKRYRGSLTSIMTTFSAEQKMTQQLKAVGQEGLSETPFQQEPALQYQRGINASGLHPLGRAVLLWPLETGLKTHKIHLPDAVKQRQMVLDTVGWVVEMGSECHKDEGGVRCKVGDPVIVAALSGSMRDGKDGVLYRFVNHRDIYGLVDRDHPMLGDQNA